MCDDKRRERLKSERFLELMMSSGLIWVSWVTLESKSNNGVFSVFCNCGPLRFGYKRFHPKILKMCKTISLI
ncbi:hypothetical protein Bca4012_025118 [Brassica carinata]